MNGTSILAIWAASSMIGMVMVNEVSQIDSNLWSTISGGVNQALETAGLPIPQSQPDPALMSQLNNIVAQGTAGLSAFESDAASADSLQTSTIVANPNTSCTSQGC